MIDDPHLEWRLKEYPHMIPCPKHRWHWLDRSNCKTCTARPNDCLLQNKTILTKDVKNLRLFNHNQKN